MRSGLDLAQGYYEDVVKPLLRTRRPGLPHAAGRLGSGSDVLGLDDEMSHDHDWGLRLTLLVEAEFVTGVSRLLDEELPDTYAGRPTRFATTWDPVVTQRVQVDTTEGFAASRLGLDATSLTSADWLCLTGQSLLEVTAGPVFSDTPGTLTALRGRLAWYPEDVWRHVVATDWIRLGQDLPLLGRAGQRGDELGARVLAARMANTAMHLAFLLERQWPPYPKWLGTRLLGLPVGRELAAELSTALTEPAWPRRQEALAGALEILRAAQHAAGLPVPAVATERFFDRPFLGVTAGTSDLLLASIEDPQVRALPRGVGSVEQWIDNVAILSDPPHRVSAARSYLATHSPNLRQP